MKFHGAKLKAFALPVAAALLFLATPDLNATPRISCNKPVFQFGTRDSSETVEHSFELKNTGTSDLTITAIRPACGCTATELTRPTIPPGETAKISTKLTLAGRSGEARKTISVESNDPANPTIVLAMEGKIATEFDVAPPVMTLRQPAAGQSATGSVQITSNAQSFRITGNQSSDPSVHIFCETATDGRSHQISAKIEKLSESDPKSFLVTLQTDHPRAPTIDIPAVVAPTRKFIAAPASIVLTAGNKPVKRTIIVKEASSGEFFISNIIVPQPEMIATPIKMGGLGYRIELNGVFPNQELNGKHLQIQIDDGTLVEIPFELRQ